MSVLLFVRYPEIIFSVDVFLFVYLYIKKFVAYIATTLMLSNKGKVVANKGSKPRDVEKYF